jgi:hypothetical protein
MFNVNMIMNVELRRFRRRHQRPIFKGIFKDLQGGGVKKNHGTC